MNLFFDVTRGAHPFNASFIPLVWDLPDQHLQLSVYDAILLMSA